MAVLNDGSWVRGTIVNVENNQYKVALIDYAEIISTDKVCRLEKRFVDIPEFACVCSGKVECMDLLEKVSKVWNSNSSLISSLKYFAKAKKEKLFRKNSDVNLNFKEF